MDGERAPPERAFWLLSDETRLAILRTLAEADGPVAFSDLRARIGNPNSGGFNYHLDALQDHFVATSGAGYTLTGAGREVVRAVHSGAITDRPHLDPEPIGGDCAECGATLLVRYDGHGVVECPDCEERVMWNEFPPAGLANRSAAEFAAAFDTWIRHRFALAIDGVCPNCASPTDADMVDAADSGLATVHGCAHCGYEARVPLLGHAIRHPAVVAFFHERGLDVTETPYWELQSITGGAEMAVLEEDPWRARVTIQYGDATLRLSIDEDLAVTAADVSRR